MTLRSFEISFHVEHISGLSLSLSRGHTEERGLPVLDKFELVFILRTTWIRTLFFAKKSIFFLFNTLPGETFLPHFPPPQEAQRGGHGCREVPSRSPPIWATVTRPAWRPEP